MTKLTYCTIALAFAPLGGLEQALATALTQTAGEF